MGFAARPALWLVAVAAVALPAAGLWRIGPRETDGVLRIGCAPSGVKLDPHEGDWRAPARGQLLYALWEGLTVFDAAAHRILPGAAQAWDISADGRNYTFHLRPEARWSNGDAVTAHDFIRAWQLALTTNDVQWGRNLPVVRASYARSGGPLPPAALAAQARDDLTLEIALDEPNADLLFELADVRWLPLHRATENLHDERAYFGRGAQLVSNGAFRLERADERGYLLGRNPHYRAASRLRRIEFVRMESPALARALLARGELDYLPLVAGPVGETPPDVIVEREPLLQVRVFELNQRRGPLTDSRVRQALSLALNRDELVAGEASTGLRPARTLLPAEFSAQPPLTEDPARARALLAEAGFPGGRGLPPLQIVATTGSRENSTIWGAVEQWRRELGLTFWVTYNDAASYRAKVSAGENDLTLSVWAGTNNQPRSLLDGLISARLTTFTGWSDPELVSWISAAGAAGPERERQLLAASERRGLDALPMIPLEHLERVSWRRRAVGGWQPHPLGFVQLREIFLDESRH